MEFFIEAHLSRFLHFDPCQILFLSSNAYKKRIPHDISASLRPHIPYLPLHESDLYPVKVSETMSIRTTPRISQTHKDTKQNPQPQRRKVHFSPNIQVIPADLPLSSEKNNANARPNRDPSRRLNPIIKPPSDFDKEMLIETLREMVNIAEKGLRMYYMFLRDKDIDEAFLINERFLRLKARRRAIRDAGDAGFTMRVTKKTRHSGRKAGRSTSQSEGEPASTGT